MLKGPPDPVRNQTWPTGQFLEDEPANDIYFITKSYYVQTSCGGGAVIKLKYEGVPGKSLPGTAPEPETVERNANKII